MKILIIDDEAPLRNLMKEMLAEEGIEFMEAGNGVEAAQQIQQSMPDVIITDLVMPEKNGIDLIMETRKKNRDLKIIAVTGGGGINGHYNYLEIAKLVGATEVLEKPVNFDRLKLLIHSK